MKNAGKMFVHNWGNIDSETKSQEFDPCPMGCGRTTDDIYGGPCTECESNF